MADPAVREAAVAEVSVVVSAAVIDRAAAEADGGEEEAEGLCVQHRRPRWR